jgi:hypothetical protein
VTVEQLLEDVPVTEAERVERWRLDTLVYVGYSMRAAIELAHRLDVNLHDACDLLAAGCDPATAARILL